MKRRVSYILYSCAFRAVCKSRITTYLESATKSLLNARCAQLEKCLQGPVYPSVSRQRITRRYWARPASGTGALPPQRGFGEGRQSTHCCRSVGSLGAKHRYIRQCDRVESVRVNPNARGTANRSASATSSKVVRSRFLARSTNSREMVIVTSA
jgi:hypothetical protein